MQKAIQVKRQILGSELSEDIAYLYNELAVTYQGNDDLLNASKCVKKQIDIFEHLNKTMTPDYVFALTFLAGMYVDMEMRQEAIEAFEKALAIHEKVTEESTQTVSDQMHLSMVPDALEKVAIMKILSEQYLASGQVVKGIEVA